MEVILKTNAAASKKVAAAFKAANLSLEQLTVARDGRFSFQDGDVVTLKKNQLATVGSFETPDNQKREYAQFTVTVKRGKVEKTAEVSMRTLCRPTMVDEAKADDFTEQDLALRFGQAPEITFAKIDGVDVPVIANDWTVTLKKKGYKTQWDADSRTYAIADGAVATPMA